MEFNKVLEARFSVRDFSSKEVEESKINEILKSAQIAPTGKNKQCQTIYNLKSKQAIEKIRAITNNAFNAPLVFITCANLDRECVLTSINKSLKDTDVAIVQTYMMLTATNLGLGSCWVCRFDPNKVKKEFNLPSNVEPLNLLVVGYPSENAEPSPRHFERIDFSEYTTIL